MDRIIALIDMDCFYVQVEQRAEPSKWGLPCAVVQYKTYKGGGIIAVNYEARAQGVTRFMTGDDARLKCPTVHLFRVPETRGKGDLTRYREAGAEVIKVLVDSRMGCVERASVDEAYMDLTEEVGQRLIRSAISVSAEQLPNTIVAGYETTTNEISDGFQSRSSADNWLQLVSDTNTAAESDADRSLAIGAAIVEELRAAILTQTGFRCSAGIAHNKVLAKLACGMNKPNKQTVLPQSAVNHVFTKTPLSNVRNFGGKFGEYVVEKLGVEFMAELCQFSEAELQARLGERAMWVYNICRGVDSEPVVPRQITLSIGCSKNFFGKEQLTTREKIEYWLSQMALEVYERLVKDRESNRRIAKTITLSVTYLGFPSYQSATRCFAITRYDAKKFTDDALSVLQHFNTSSIGSTTWSPAIVMLGLSAGKFIDIGGTNFGSMQRFVSVSNKRAECSAKCDKPGYDGSTRRDSSPERSSSCSHSEHRVDFCRAEKSQEPSGFVSSDENTDVVRNAFISTADTSPSKSRQTRVDDADSVSLSPVFNRCLDGLVVEHGLADPIDTERSSPATDVVKCELCCADISPWHLPEHLDWHVAADLQRQERTLSRQKTDGTGLAAASSVVSKKRKHSSANPMTHDSSKNVNPSAGTKKLSSFFTPTAR